MFPSFRTYLIFGCFCFSMFFFVWFFVPETKGVSLEAMDALFGVTDDSPSKGLRASTGDGAVDGTQDANKEKEKESEKDKEVPHAREAEVA